MVGRGWWWWETEIVSHQKQTVHEDFLGKSKEKQKGMKEGETRETLVIDSFVIILMMTA